MIIKYIKTAWTAELVSVFLQVAVKWHACRNQSTLTDLCSAFSQQDPVYQSKNLLYRHLTGTARPTLSFPTWAFFQQRDLKASMIKKVSLRLGKLQKSQQKPPISGGLMITGTHRYGTPELSICMTPFLNVQCVCNSMLHIIHIWIPATFKSNSWQSFNIDQ